MSAPHRKLTTIFSADVQGYSRLMEADEEGTLAKLKAYRDAMAGLIAAHGGRVVNTWGDGLIAEFPSVVEAVRTAVDVQSELAERNAGLADAARMLFRIGINLGDVIADDGDIYGDGVNIAARLQTSAAPGGIVISNTVYDQVRNKVTVGFEFLGPLAVKNLEEAVPSYAVRIGVQDQPSAPVMTAGAVPSAGQQSAEPASPPQASLRRRPVERRYTVFAVLAAALIAINLLSWPGTFWAAWPVLVLAGLAGLSWARQTLQVDAASATMVVVALFVVGVNLLSWNGTFWAVWPLLGIAFGLAIRWAGKPKTP